MKKFIGEAVKRLSQQFRDQHPTIRFDLNYADTGEPSDWDTGEWLVQAGGRIR